MKISRLYLKMLREIQRRTDGGWRPSVKVKYRILVFLKDGVILFCHSSFETKRMSG